MNDWMETGLETGVEKPGYSSMKPRFMPRLYLPVGANTEIVLLDDPDNAAVVYEHGIYIQGDKNSMKLRETCMSAGEEPIPSKCRLCAGMIRDDRIVRQCVSFLTCISLDSFTYDKISYTHLKKLVPLNNKASKKLLQRKKDFGSLVGGHFKLFRSDQTSPRVGDDWQWVGRLNLIKRFTGSPRIPQLMKSAKKAGKSLSPAAALKDMITPFDYKTVLAPTSKKTNYFLGYIGLDDQVKGGSTPPAESEQPVYEDTPSGGGGGEEDFKEYQGEEAPSPPKKKKKVKKVIKKKGAKKKKKKKILK